MVVWGVRQMKAGGFTYPEVAICRKELPWFPLHPRLRRLEEVAAASQPTQPTPVDPVVLRLPESWATSETAMLELWELNPEWDIEVTDEGALSKSCLARDTTRAKSAAVGGRAGHELGAVGRTVGAPAARTAW